MVIVQTIVIIGVIALREMMFNETINIRVSNMSLNHFHYFAAGSRCPRIWCTSPERKWEFIHQETSTNWLFNSNNKIMKLTLSYWSLFPSALTAYRGSSFIHSFVFCLFFMSSGRKTASGWLLSVWMQID